MHSLCPTLSAYFPDPQSLQSGSHSVGELDGLDKYRPLGHAAPSGQFPLNLARGSAYWYVPGVHLGHVVL